MPDPAALRDALKKCREAHEELEELHAGLAPGDDYPEGIEEATDKAQEAWSEYLAQRRRVWGV